MRFFLHKDNSMDRFKMAFFHFVFPTNTTARFKNAMSSFLLVVVVVEAKTFEIA